MDEWLEIPWDKKPKSAVQFKVKKIIAKRRKAKGLPALEKKEIPVELRRGKKKKKAAKKRATKSKAYSKVRAKKSTAYSSTSGQSKLATKVSAVVASKVAAPAPANFSRKVATKVAAPSPPVSKVAAPASGWREISLEQKSDTDSSRAQVPVAQKSYAYGPPLPPGPPSKVAAPFPASKTYAPSPENYAVMEESNAVSQSNDNAFYSASKVATPFTASKTYAPSFENNAVMEESKVVSLSNDNPYYSASKVAAPFPPAKVAAPFPPSSVEDEVKIEDTSEAGTSYNAKNGIGKRKVKKIKPNGKCTVL